MIEKIPKQNFTREEAERAYDEFKRFDDPYVDFVDVAHHLGLILGLVGMDIPGSETPKPENFQKVIENYIKRISSNPIYFGQHERFPRVKATLDELTK